MHKEKEFAFAVAAPPARLASWAHTVRALATTARPKQWTKNLILYLALIFSLNEYWSLADLPTVLRLFLLATAGFGFFCLLSSAVYILNDLHDLEEDRQHPLKRHRPLPSGELRLLPAAITAGGFLAISLGGSFWLQPAFGLTTVSYLALMLLYSFVLKHLVILDVFTIAGGFVLRAMAGALVIGVPISPWLYLCTILGALFLGFSKRRHELLLLNTNAASHRRILTEYTPELLEQMIVVVATATVIAYGLYTFTAEKLPQNKAMMLTIPFVLYGIFRYLYLIHLKNAGGSPEDVLLRDWPLLIDILLWVAVSAIILSVFR